MMNQHENYVAELGFNLAHPGSAVAELGFNLAHPGSAVRCTISCAMLQPGRDRFAIT